MSDDTSPGSSADTATATATAPAVDWSAHVPPEYAATFEPYKGKSLGDVFKGYGEAAKLIGARPQGLKVPDDKSTPEDVAAFRKALGVPEDPKGYQYQRPDIALDGGWDETAEQEFLAVAHKEALPPRAVQAVMTWYGKFIRGQVERARTEALEVGSQLRQEWGANYEANIGRANRALQEFGGDALVDHLTASGLGRHPLMVKAWAKVGSALVEHGAMRGDGLPRLSAEDARAKADELRAELNKLPESHPRRSALVEEIVAVTKRAAR